MPPETTSLWHGGRGFKFVDWSRYYHVHSRRGYEFGDGKALAVEVNSSSFTAANPSETDFKVVTKWPQQKDEKDNNPQRL